MSICSFPLFAAARLKDKKKELTFGIDGLFWERLIAKSTDLVIEAIVEYVSKHKLFESIDERSMCVVSFINFGNRRFDIKWCVH